MRSSLLWGCSQSIRTRCLHRERSSRLQNGKNCGSNELSFGRLAYWVVVIQGASGVFVILKHTKKSIGKRSKG
jgi:hypothetical protein